MINFIRITSRKAAQGRLKFAEFMRRSHWPNFCLRYRGFERVSMGCRAPDRVGPKSGLSEDRLIRSSWRLAYSVYNLRLTRRIHSFCARFLTSICPNFWPATWSCFTASPPTYFQIFRYLRSSTVSLSTPSSMSANREYLFPIEEWIAEHLDFLFWVRRSMRGIVFLYWFSTPLCRSELCDLKVVFFLKHGSVRLNVFLWLWW